MKNKTKMTLIISALSLCMLSVGASAIVAKADTTTPEFAVTFAGASVRINETEKEDGIRFAVRMSKDVWDTYNSDIEETYVKISNGTVWGAPIDTTGKWYPVDEEGKYAANDFVGYQATVCLYGDFDARMNFTVQSFTKFVGEDEVVASDVSPERSFSYVAKRAVAEDASLLEYLKDYMYYDVALELDGETTVQSIKYGETVTDVTLPGYVVEWEKDGEAFDIATSITEDMTLVGEKALKPILPSASSYMQGNGAPAAEGKVNVQYNVEKSGEMAAMLMSYSPGAWVDTYAQWKFDITLEDIQAWREAGYEAISFKVFAQAPTGTVAVNAYGMSTAESFTNATWKTIRVSLDVLETSYKYTFWVSFGAYSSGFVAGITEATLEMPKELPTVKMASSSYMQGYVGSSFKESTDGKEYDVEVAGKTAILKQTFAFSGWLSSQVGQWKFDVTADDIAAWKDAGKTKLTFELYVSGNQASPYVQIFGKTFNLTQKAWTTIEIDIDTFEAKYTNAFQIFASDGGSGTKAVIAITQPVWS